MAKTEWLELIAHGENPGAELTRDALRPEQLAQEIVALANLQGAGILIEAVRHAGVHWMAFEGAGPPGAGAKALTGPYFAVASERSASRYSLPKPASSASPLSPSATGPPERHWAGPSVPALDLVAFGPIIPVGLRDSCAVAPPTSTAFCVAWTGLRF